MTAYHLAAGATQDETLHTIHVMWDKAHQTLDIVTNNWYICEKSDG